MSFIKPHLNCGTMCPPSERATRGRGGWLSRGHMVCHCLLLETDAGLVLVDATEVAWVVAFLCSPKSRAINGDAVCVGGGAAQEADSK